MSEEDNRKWILVVDDEPAICWAFERLFASEGLGVVTKSSAEEGIDALQDRTPALILLDVRLPRMDGISALTEFRKLAAETPIIIMTAFGDLETAVSAVKHGATDYITKPFELEEVRRASLRAIENSGGASIAKGDSSEQASDTGTEVEPKNQTRTHQRTTELIGASPAIQQIFKQIALVADSDLSVLVTGETGTGKELVAAAIHRHSPRAEAPYLPIAPVALNPDLIESELFGHVAGAFTGATSDRAGVFEQAEGGTVLLDEIGDLPLSVQVKLLRVLDQKQFFRVGDVRPRSCNVRILAATNCDLQHAVEQGTFREDLYYRLNGLCMHLPPLRERKEDIPLLATFFLQQMRYKNTQLTPEMLGHLAQRHWSGNVRELRNAIEHAAVLARGRAIHPEDLPSAQPLRHSATPSNLLPSFEPLLKSWFAERTSGMEDVPVEGLHEKFLAEVEPILMRLALEWAHDNRTKAAELLGIHRATLREKLKTYGID